MAYPAYRPERRRKRRRWLLIALSIVVIIALVAVLVSRQTEERGTVEFFAAADTAATLHDEAARSFNDTVASIGLITRQDLTRRLETVVEKATIATDGLDDVSPPSSIGVPFGTMMTASTAWKSGAVEFDRVMLGIIDGDIVESAVAELQGALDQLRVGDVAYGEFQKSLAGVPSEIEVPEFDDITYIEHTSDDPLRYNATNLVLRIQGAYSLSPHRDVSILGMTDPEPIGDRNGIPVVPSSESLSVNAVVTNEGNEDAPLVTVVLDVLDVDSGTTFQLSDSAADLPAGGSTTIVFADLDIAKGGLYQIKLTATIDDDIEPGNDVWDLRFIWNAES